MIGVVRCGNTGSVLQALRYHGAEAELFGEAGELTRLGKVSAIVLPGNGNFGSVMSYLEENNWIDLITKWIKSDLPFLGICVGLQVLFDESEEHRASGVNAPVSSAEGAASEKNSRGLGIVRGVVRKFMSGKVPLVGWNKTSFSASSKYGSRNLASSLVPDKGEYFYYLHSYYADCSEHDCIAATASYGKEYCACVERGALTAVQFHPEKSGKAGHAFLRRWMEVNRAG